MLPVLQIGPFAIQAPSLLLLLGLWLGLTVGARFTKQFNVPSKKLDDVSLLSILIALIGGRVFYILRFPDAFLQNLTSILSLNPALFDFSTGLLVGGIGLLIIIQRKKMNLWATLDALTIPLAIFMLFFGLSHIASGKVYGLPTSVPWAINLFGESRHPTQIYEVFLTGGILFYLIRRIQKIEGKGVLIPGKYFLEYVSLTSLAWIIIETFRADTIFFVSNIRTIQLVALIILIGSFWMINQRLSSQNAVGEGE